MFEKFARVVNAKYNTLAQQELYEVDVDLAPVYLAAFPAGTDPLYITNTEHDCSCCKNFLRNLGNLVAIKDGKVQTIWDVTDVPYPYDVVAAELHRAVLNAPIKQIFRTKERSYGAESTLQQIESGVKKWNHFWGKVHDRHYSASPGQQIGAVEALIHVYKRGLEEFDVDTLETVSELITSNQIYRGQEHAPALNAFRKLWVNYHACSSDESNKILYIWETYCRPGAQIRNTVIGSLLQDIQSGMSVDAAVRSFEQKVAPANYKRPTAPITESMVKSALKTIDELGIKDSLDRRMAKLSDISVNDVLWVNNSTQKKMRDSIADVLFDSVKKRKPNKTVSSTMSMEQFIEDSKNYTDIQLFVKNSHQNKFVTLTAPVHADSKNIFKWNNNFAWSYDGDMTDSIKERVKRAGGNVTNAKLRVSLVWFNTDDLDLYMTLPNRNTIYFANKRDILDVDMNVRDPVCDPVENMSFTSANLADGEYTIAVNQYRQRETTDVGCTIEIECDGAIQQWHYKNAVRGRAVFGSIVIKNGSIENIIVNSGWENFSAPVQKWNISTEQYQTVSAITLSPNFWNQSAVGNKHWIFVIDGCKTPDNVRGIYNEYLTQDLMQHRKVFEVLGSKTKCKNTDEQVSGLGFSSTQREELNFCVTTADGQKKTITVVV